METSGTQLHLYNHAASNCKFIKHENELKVILYGNIIIIGQIKLNISRFNVNKNK